MYSVRTFPPTAKHIPLLVAAGERSASTHTCASSPPLEKAFIILISQPWAKLQSWNGSNLESLFAVLAKKAAVP